MHVPTFVYFCEVGTSDGHWQATPPEQDYMVEGLAIVMTDDTERRVLTIQPLGMNKPTEIPYPADWKPRVFQLKDSAVPKAITIQEIEFSVLSAWIPEQGQEYQYFDETVHQDYRPIMHMKSEGDTWLIALWGVHPEKGEETMKIAVPKRFSESMRLRVIANPLAVYDGHNILLIEGKRFWEDG